MNYKKLVPVGGILILLGVVSSLALLPSRQDKSLPEGQQEASGEVPHGSFQVSESDDTQEPARADEADHMETSLEAVFEAIPSRAVWQEVEIPEIQEGTPRDVSRETWSDPVNQKVLGERRWMAEPGQAEQERIEAVLNTPMPPTRLGIEARSQAITEMQLHLERCQTDYPTGGRIVVIWEIAGDGQLATSKDVRLGPMVDVTDEQFLDCITQFTPPSSPTTERFRMTVEYPAFLEDR